MMQKLMLLAVVGLLSASMVGCAHIPGGTNLNEVAQNAKLKNVTTGDGTFENYTATGHYTSHEIGIGLGFGLLKLAELYPFQTNEEQLTIIASEAQAAGADAMINVTPHRQWFFGFPFIVIGIYVDTCEGTGIKTK